MLPFEILARRGGVDFRALTPLQRVLLVTDGTVTDILEAHFLEPIRLVKLAQRVAGESLERRILLRGANSGRVYVYAESVIALDRLDKKLREELLNSDMPLGRLWIEHKLETFKEPFEARFQPAGELAGHFGVDAAAALLMRSYRVISGGAAVMTISEYFGGV